MADESWRTRRITPPVGTADSQPDYYEVLQVSPNADVEVIQAAHKRLLEKWFSDRKPGDPSAFERMTLLDEAYAVLSDSQKREEYDTRRKHSVSEPGANPRPTSASSTPHPAKEIADTQGHTDQTPTSDAHPQTSSQRALLDGPSLRVGFIILVAVVTIAVISFLASKDSHPKAEITQATTTLPRTQPADPFKGRPLDPFEAMENPERATREVVVPRYLKNMLAVEKSWKDVEPELKKFDVDPELYRQDYQREEARANERLGITTPVNNGLRFLQWLVAAIGAALVFIVIRGGRRSRSLQIEGDSMADESWRTRRITPLVAPAGNPATPSAKESPTAHEPSTTSHRPWVWVGALLVSVLVFFVGRGVLNSGRTARAEEYYNRAAEWKKDKMYDKEIQDLDEAIKLDPKDARYFHSRGYAWCSLKEYDKGIKDFDEAIRLAPRMDTPYAGRALAWFDKGDYDRAIVDYDEAIRLDPSKAHYYVIRGNAWDRKNNHSKAQKDFEEAARLDPARCGLGRSIDCSRRGDAWAQQKEYDKAISEFTEALRLDPTSAHAYSGRGLAWFDKKDFDRAIEDFDEAIRLNPQSAGYFVFRGQAWEAKKNSKRSQEDFKEAARLDPRYGALVK